MEYNKWSVIIMSKAAFVLKNKSGNHLDSFDAPIFSIKKEKNEWNILNKNPFYPIFIYRNREEVYLSNSIYELSKLKLALTIEDKNVVELVLFNTNLNHNTPYKEIEQVNMISSIKLEMDTFSFKFYDKKADDSVIEVFSEIVATQKGARQRASSFLLSGGGESRINAAISTSIDCSVFYTWGNPEHKEYKIAQKITQKLNHEIVNIQPEIKEANYINLLTNSLGLINPQFTYRVQAIEAVNQNRQSNIIWTGWGDINGYPTTYQPSELFTEFFLGLFKGELNLIPGFNKEWLASFQIENHDLVREIKDKPDIDTFFNIKQRELAPRIFGQVLSYENTIMPVFAPWFHPDIYQAVHEEEKKNPRLRLSKAHRSIWKGELYYQLINQFNPALNKIKHAKGYYPYMLRKKYGILGLGASYIMKKIENRKQYPFDRVENLDFIKTQLLSVYHSEYNVFDKDCILDWIKRINSLSGVEIFNAFKVIQVFWILEKGNDNAK